jgi:hypothetical protein
MYVYFLFFSSRFKLDIRLLGQHVTENQNCNKLNIELSLRQVREMEEGKCRKHGRRR